MSIAARVLDRLRKGPAEMEDLIQHAYSGAEAPLSAMNIVSQAVLELRKQGIAIRRRCTYELAPRR